MDPTNDSQSVAEQAADALVSQAQLQEQTSETTEAIREQSDALEDGTDTLDKFAAGGLFALASMGSLEGGVGQTARAVSTLFTETLKTTFKQINDSSALAQETLGSFRNLNTEIGGLSNTLIATGGELGTFAEKSFQMQKDFQMAQGGMGDAAVTFQNSLGQTTNAFNFLYKNIEDAEKDFVEFRSEVTEGNAILMNNLSSAAAMEMTILKRQLQLTGDETAELLETQYALTGEANADVAKSIVTTARSLELATGLPLNKLKEDIIGITTDLDTFGDIGVKSAGRLAAAIGQAGLDLQSFKGMTEQFMDFDNSAKKMGDLSAMFGIQMDAMEMTYLANENQEEFFHRMREDVLAAGHDVENMSRARQKMLADQMGLSVKQMRTFMLEGGDALDQFELEEATDKADDLDAMQTAITTFKDAEGALRTSLEAAASKSAVMAAGAVTEFAKVEDSMLNAATAAQNIKITPAQIQSARTMAATFNDTAGQMSIKAGEMVATFMQGAGSLASSTVNTTAAVMKDGADALAHAASFTNSVVENVKSSIPGASEGSVNVKTSYDTKELGNTINQANNPLVQSIANSNNATAGLTTQVQNLTSNLANQRQPVILKLGEKPLGKVVIELLKNTTTASGQQVVFSGGA